VFGLWHHPNVAKVVDASNGMGRVNTVNEDMALVENYWILKSRERERDAR
jgi:hypothetical protein